MASFTLTASFDTVEDLRQFLNSPHPSIGAPSIAVAAAQPSAQEVAPVSSPLPTSESSLPAPPAPVVVAPPAPVAHTSPAAAAVDSSGMPWDERIHAGNKATKTDGTWVAKRGVNDKLFVAQVEAELRARVAQSTPAAAPPTPMPLAPAPVAAPPMPVIPPPVQVAPPAPPVPVPAAPDPAAAPTVAAQTWTFTTLLTAMTRAMIAGALTEDKVVATCKEHVGPHYSGFGDVAVAMQTDPGLCDRLALHLGLA